MGDDKEKSHEANSDEENEMNLVNTKKPRKTRCLIDSDSDSESTKDHVISNDKSEDVETGNEDVDEPSAIKKKSKRIAVLDSDSEEEQEMITPHDKSFPDLINTPEAVVYSANSKGQLVPENVGETIQKSQGLLALCDSESSDEDREMYSASNQHSEELDEPPIKPKIYKKRKSKNQEDQPKRMTAQEAAQQKVEIRAESQRRVRESSVSLPYHKPKSYTIKEFLEKRAKLPSAIPLLPKAPPSLAIKMSKDKLAEMSKKLDERIKEVEEFYKSDSDDEDREDESNENMTNDVRSWLDLILVGAMDKVDAKASDNVDVSNEEVTKETQEEKEPESIDYDFNLEGIESEEYNQDEPKLPHIPDVLHLQPKLKGNPDDVIDLDSGISKPNAIKTLVDKFFQHTARKHSHKHKVKLDIVEVSGGGDIVKETVSMEVEDEEEPAQMEVPGAKLQKLREELQNQMAQKRSEMWKHKQQQGDTVLSSEKKIVENDDPDYKEEDDFLDDEEEVEMSESSSEEEIDEDVDDIDHFKEKPRTKSAFVDDEAEESDIEEDEGDKDDNEVDEDNTGFEGDDEKLDEEYDETKNEEEPQKPKQKVLKRIVKAFTEDSDEDEENNVNDTITTKADENLNSTASCDEDVIPPNLPKVHKTPQRPSLENAKSQFDFLTPVSYLTGLQNLDSKFQRQSPGISPFHPMAEPSPLKDKDWHVGLQKKLFVDQPSDDTSQSNIDELADMCSGKFPETQADSIVPNHENAPSTQDLLDVCSGDFSSGFPSTLATQKSSSKETVQEIKDLGDDHDQIISQLIDEDELERFKKKFESPIKSLNKSSLQFEEDADEVQATGLIDSDDETDGLELKSKKKRKKLAFSDDEDSDEEKNNDENEEEIDLHDDIDDVNYDSEENEVPVQEYKPSDFFENEAELSESEWDSADEDERDLDKLEFEQADEEVFDENKVRSDLERIHMRQILDNDNREVQFLQELLLEDGEMHGSGRQRQFKWKNVDSLGNEDEEKKNEEEIYLDEEESEEQWRKKRHEREMFLKEREMKDDVESILSDSQILKVGQVIMRKSQSFGSQSNTPPANSDDAEKEPFGLLSKRGSFLGRKDNVLERLAAFTKVTTNVSGATAKNSRNFVFQTVEAVETTTVVKSNINNNKRKAVDGTPNAIKKLRLGSELSPLVKKQTPKPGGPKVKLF